MKGGGGGGRSYKEQQWEQVNLPDCGKYLARGSLDAHFQTQYGVAKGGPVQEGNGEGGCGEPRKYRMEFP